MSKTESEKSEPLGILILAAGNSSRFGSCKLLTDCMGKPLISHSLNTALAIPEASVQVVTGAWHDELKSAMATDKVPTAPLLFNQNWQQGMGSSVALGVKTMANKHRQILILLADQPLITLADCRTLLLLDSSADICCAQYSGQRGVPALFRSSTFSRLQQLQGQKGAKTLLNDPYFKVTATELPQAAQDIDYPQDLDLLTGVRINT